MTGQPISIDVLAVWFTTTQRLLLDAKNHGDEKAMRRANIRQRVEPIRSKAIREAARGEECTLQVFGCCVGGIETTVLAHLHDEAGFGVGQKADDSSAVFACHGCHDEIDGRTRRTRGQDLTWYKLRALQRTVRRLIEKQVYPAKLDVEKSAAARSAKPRTAKASRPIPQRENPWPTTGRKIASRNTLTKA